MGGTYTPLLWLGCFVAAFCGCATSMPPPAPSLAETDPVLATPMRPRSQPAERPRWFDFENVLDPRSRTIEQNLGF
jgi:hypothetical protein